jgi:glucose-6-phosphate 1-dehydrogenase
MMAKKVGLTKEFNKIPLNFDYRKDEDLPDAYERILLDAMRGDQTLFTRTDEVAAEWVFISKIVEGWEKEKPVFPNYQAGSWGPKEAEDLIRHDGRRWLL